MKINYNKTTLIARRFLIVLTISFPLFTPSNTLAAEYGYYDCNPDHAYAWDHGALASRAAIKKLGIHFQQRTENTGVLATGMKAPWGQTELQILQGQSGTSDLVALQTVANKDQVGTTILRISAGDGVKSKFILLGDSFSGEIISGYCKYISSPNHLKSEDQPATGVNP